MRQMSPTLTVAQRLGGSSPCRRSVGWKPPRPSRRRRVRFRINLDILPGSEPEIVTSQPTSTEPRREEDPEENHRRRRPTPKFIASPDVDNFIVGRLRADLAGPIDSRDHEDRCHASLGLRPETHSPVQGCIAPVAPDAVRHLDQLRTSKTIDDGSPGRSGRHGRSRRFRLHLADGTMCSQWMLFRARRCTPMDDVRNRRCR